MDVLLTGAFGRVGTAIIDGLADRAEYEFTYLDRREHPEHDAVVADVAEYDEIRPAFEGQDAVIHLAGDPSADAEWPSVLENNVIGTYNAVEAACDAGVERFVFASSNHVVGMYEVENAPEVYEPSFDRRVDHTVQPRPDSHYGVSKLFGEGLGRYYVEHPDRRAPERFYALRICGVRGAADDHPYADAERAVEAGRCERGDAEYRRLVARRKAMWSSRRDFAHLIDRTLQDESVSFDVFYAVSDNDGRWFDIEHARDVLGYEPRDDGAAWDEPP